MKSFKPKSYMVRIRWSGKFRNYLDMEDEGEKKILGLSLEFSFGHATFVVCRTLSEQAVGCTKLELRRNVWVEIKD